MFAELGVIVLGVALLGFAGIFALAGRREWRLWRVMVRLDPVTPDQLGEAARAGRLPRGPVAVVGVAVAGRGGPLKSTVNSQPCVWHRHTVHRRRMRMNARGQQRPSLLRKRVTDIASPEPFFLAGTANRVVLQPMGIPVDRPGRAATRVLPGVASKPFPDAAGLAGPDRFTHREWIVQSGTQLYVLGEAAVTDAAIVVRRPARGPHLISTRGAAGLRRHQLTSAATAFALAAVCAGAGLAALIP